jgi:hypothetical protein
MVTEIGMVAVTAIGVGTVAAGSEFIEPLQVAIYSTLFKINGSTDKLMNNKMKTIKLMPLLAAGLLVVLMTSCGPGYVSTGVNYGPRPYYGYGYSPYGYYRPPVVVRRPPVVVRQRYHVPAPRYNNYNRGSSPNARSGSRGSYGGGGRSRGPR